MKGKQTALFPGNEDKVGFWLTPPDVMKRFDDEFHFDFDACPFPRPAGFDGLVEDWGLSTWCNPPICKGSHISEWIHKAISESQKGKRVVIILPMPRWVRYLLQAKAEIRWAGEIHYLNPQGKASPSEGGNHYPDVLFILNGSRLSIPDAETGKPRSQE